MAIYFSDLHVNSMARALLDPGEQLLHRGSASHSPWWGLGMPFFASQYLILVTTHRVLLVRHRRGLLTGDRMESVESLPYGAIEKAKLSGLFLKKKLALVANQGRVKLNLSMAGGFLEIKGNLEAGKALIDAWNRGRSLPAPSVAGMLAA